MFVLDVNGTNTSNTLVLNSLCFKSSLNANTAIAAVISICTLLLASLISIRMRSTTPASTMISLLRSELAARLRNVDIAWHWTSSLSSYDNNSIKGLTNPSSMIGDSLAGWMDILRIQATDDKVRGRKDDLRRRNNGFKPLQRTISNWYFSILSHQYTCYTMSLFIYLPSDAKFRSANAAWHWTLRLFVSINAIRYCTSFESDCASFFRLPAIMYCIRIWIILIHACYIPSTAMLLNAVVQ